MIEEQVRLSIADKLGDLLAQPAVGNTDPFDHGHESLPSVGGITSRCACVAPSRRREGAERPAVWSPSFGCSVECEAKRGGDARAIGGIGLGAVGDMALFDFDAAVTH